MPIFIAAHKKPDGEWSLIKMFPYSEEKEAKATMKRLRKKFPDYAFKIVS